MLMVITTEMLDFLLYLILVYGGVLMNVIVEEAIKLSIQVQAQTIPNFMNIVGIDNHDNKGTKSNQTQSNTSVYSIRY